jgi:hypothetical protein
LALVSFLTAPLGLVLLLFLKWPWTWKLSVVAMWAFLVGYHDYGWVQVLLGLFLLVFSVAMLVSKEKWARAVGGISIVFFAATFAGVWLPPASSLALRRVSPAGATDDCVFVYADQRALFASLPLHGGACYSGESVSYSWEDCGGAATFTIVRQTCEHQQLTDGSLKMSTAYTIGPWLAPWLTRAGGNSFVVRADGSVLH